MITLDAEVLSISADGIATIRCPLCGELHYHTLPLGLRRPHCKNWDLHLKYCYNLVMTQNTQLEDA